MKAGTTLRWWAHKTYHWPFQNGDVFASEKMEDEASNLDQNLCASRHQKSQSSVSEDKVTNVWINIIKAKAISHVTLM